MTAFTGLELAALRSIFSETPKLAPLLELQLADASVTERLNTGGGFFTTIAVTGNAPAICGPRVLGSETHARIAGAALQFGFILFMQSGKLHQLEGIAWSSEGIAALDLTALNFEVYRQPVPPHHRC